MRTIAHKILVSLLLLAGIITAACVTPFYILFIAMPATLAAGRLKQPRRYILDVWLGFDKFMNAAMGGDHKETISSRLGKSIDHGSPSVFFCKPLDLIIYKCLDIVDEDHCTKSIDWSVGRRFK